MEIKLLTAYNTFDNINFFCAIKWLCAFVFHHTDLIGGGLIFNA